MIAGSEPLVHREQRRNGLGAAGTWREIMGIGRKIATRARFHGRARSAVGQANSLRIEPRSPCNALPGRRAISVRVLSGRDAVERGRRDPQRNNVGDAKVPSSSRSREDRRREEGAGRPASDVAAAEFDAGHYSVLHSSCGPVAQRQRTLGVVMRRNALEPMDREFTFAASKA